MYWENVNNQSLTQVLQLYIHVSFCLKAIRPWHNLSTGGYSHVIRILDEVVLNVTELFIKITNKLYNSRG